MNNIPFEPFNWQIPVGTPEVNTPNPRNWGIQTPIDRSVAERNVSNITNDLATSSTRKINMEIPENKVRIGVKEKMKARIHRKVLPVIPLSFNFRPKKPSTKYNTANGNVRQNLYQPPIDGSTVVTKAKLNVWGSIRNLHPPPWRSGIQQTKNTVDLQDSGYQHHPIFEFQPTQDRPMVRLPKPTIPNPYKMYDVLPSLHISRFPTTIPLGITHVLNLSEEDHHPSKVENVIYFHNPMEDLDDLSLYFPSILTFIESALAIPDSEVLVHCQHGTNRSAIAVIAYLCRRFGIFAINALATLKTKTPDVSPAFNLLLQVDKWFDVPKDENEIENVDGPYEEDLVGDGVDRAMQDLLMRLHMGLRRGLGPVFGAGRVHPDWHFPDPLRGEGEGYRRVGYEEGGARHDVRFGGGGDMLYHAMPLM